MPTKLITPPATEPVTRDEAKNHCRVWHTDEDVLIASLIQTAREHIENMTSRALIKQTWELKLDRFPGSDCRYTIEPPYPPLMSVQSIAYTDTDGAAQTLDPASYVVDTDSEPGKIVPAYGMQWPATRDQINAVTVTYDAGYGEFNNSVPAPIRAALLLMVCHLYENREAAIQGTLEPIPGGVDALLGPYRVISF